MYEIIVKINGQDVVIDTADNIVTASNKVSFHRERGNQAYYRPLWNSPNINRRNVA